MSSRGRWRREEVSDDIKQVTSEASGIGNSHFTIIQKFLITVDVFLFLSI